MSVADAVQAESPLSETEPLSGTTVITEQVGPDSTKNGNVADLSEQSSTPSQKEATTKGLYLLSHCFHALTVYMLFGLFQYL